MYVCMVIRCIFRVRNAFAWGSHQVSQEGKLPALKVELIRFMRSESRIRFIAQRYPRYFFVLYEILFIIGPRFDTANAHKHHTGKEGRKEGRKTRERVFTPLLLISLLTLDCSPRSYQFAKALPSYYRALIFHGSLLRPTRSFPSNLGNFSAHQNLWSFPSDRMRFGGHHSYPFYKST